ncbi:MAG: TatD family hydrolase [bacterium]|nr:TatD family hydrolase [bacterium]
MILVDTHCHLNHPPLCQDTDGVLARAAAAQVMRVVAPAYDTPSWDDLAALAARPGVDVALGLHPWLAHDLPGQVAALEAERPVPRAELQPAAGPPAPVPPAVQAAALDRLLEHLAARVQARRPVAIGEIGLDTKITASGLAVQLPLLERQLALAVDLDLPVILHCRGAFEELLGAVGRHGGRLRGVLHAFSRGPDLAARFAGAGLHLALGGAVTRERAKQVRRAARTASLDRLVLETDAPSIGLQDVPPERTEPCHVRDIASAVAGLRGESMESVAAATTAAANRLFGF